MKVERLRLDGVLLVHNTRFTDDRGFFTELYNADRFHESGIETLFVQDNYSYSRSRGTVRGLHYQSPPYAQAKLVRVQAGRILDVVVDARPGSPTFGQHLTHELNADTPTQLFVPRGFLHGFITLADDAHVVYKVDNVYTKSCDGAVRFDDADLGIDWGVPTSEVVISDKDAAAQSWKHFSSTLG